MACDAAIPAAADALASAGLCELASQQQQPQPQQHELEPAQAQAATIVSAMSSALASASSLSAAATAPPAAPGPASDEQFYAYCLEASSLLNNLGAAHHDRGADGADDAMRSYSESIQTRIRAQDAAEAAEQEPPSRSQGPSPPPDRPSVREMDDHLAELRAATAARRRANAELRAAAGRAAAATGSRTGDGQEHGSDPTGDGGYPHDTARSLRRNETAMVGLNAFARPCLLPVDDGLVLSSAGGERLAAVISGTGKRCAQSNTSNFNEHQQQPPRPGGIMKKRRSSSGGSTGAGAATRTASSDVQKANSLAAFTLFNIGLLHQNDRSHREARESYEIAVSMLDGVPAHLTPWNVGLLRVFLLNNLGYVACRTDDVAAAAEHFQLASNGSLDLAMMYSPATATSVLHRDRTLRASRRRLARCNVAILCNLSRALGRLGNHGDSMDVSEAALQLHERMEEDEERYRQGLWAEEQQRQNINSHLTNINSSRSHNPNHNGSSAAALAPTPPPPPPADDDGLDLSVIPFVRARAYQGIRDSVSAMVEYRTFLAAAARHGHTSAHPYYVAATQSVLEMSQDDALAAIEEILAQTAGEPQAAAAA